MPAPIMRTLYGLSQSPWTERARWALDHHGIAYGYHEHVPMLGELLLRRKAGAKKASVPLLDDGPSVVMGSLEIAEHADRTGRAAALVPLELREEVARWVDLGERILQVGRARVFKRLRASPAAQAESLPSFVPGMLRGAMAPTTGMVLRFLAKKYDALDDLGAELGKTVRPVLDQMRIAVSKSEYVLSGASFSFADIVVATTLSGVRPHAAAKLGPATREVWTNEELVRDYGDLLEWRDSIYAKHRGRPA